MFSFGRYEPKEQSPVSPMERAYHILAQLSLGQCPEIPSEPPHILVEKLASFKGCENLVRISYPLYESDGRQSADWDRYFYEPFSTYLKNKVLLDGKYIAPNEYINKIFPDREECRGDIRLDRNRVVVKLGVRRPTSLNEGEIALLVAQKLHDVTGVYTKEITSPFFYPEIIAPYFRKCKEEDPVRWAVTRTMVGCGYSAAVAHYNCTPGFLGEVYGRVAGVVCNTAPDEVIRARSYSLRDGRREIFNALRRSFGELVSPELIAFALGNDAQIDAAIVHSEAFSHFVKVLPSALENGFIIDRGSELFNYQVSEGSTPEEALNHLTSLVSNIYGRDKSPWWFKENFDLRPISAQAEYAALGPIEREELAKITGFAFKYAEEAYHLAGFNLVSVGLSTDQAIKLTGEITKAFGIGNIGRAKALIEYCIEVLKDTPQSKQDEALDYIREDILNATGPSVIISALEGDSVTFEHRGLARVIPQLGIALSELADQNIAPAIDCYVTRQIITALSAPLEDRLSINRHNITFHQDTRALLTATPSKEFEELDPNQQNALEIRGGPLYKYLTFERLLRDECRDPSSGVVSVYFEYFAVRLPDPLSPPPGLISFLERFLSVSAPNYRFSMIEHPSDCAHRKSNNATSREARIKVLTDLVDASNAGLLTWKEVEQKFASLIAPVPAHVKRKIEMDRVWGELYYDQNPSYPMEEYYGEKDIALLRKRDKLRERKAVLEANGIEVPIWLTRELRGIKSERAQLYRDYNTERKSYNDPNRNFREDREWYLNSVIGSELKEYSDYLTNQRLAALTQGISLNSLLFEMARARVIPLGVASSHFRMLVGDLGIHKTKGLERVISFPYVMPVFVRSLSKLIADGMLDQDAIARAITNCYTRKDVIRVLEKVLQAVEWGKGVREGNQRQIDRQLGLEAVWNARRSHEKLRRSANSIEFVLNKNDIVGPIVTIEEEQELLEYLPIVPLLKDYSRDLGDRGDAIDHSDNSPISNVARANHLSLSTGILNVVVRSQRQIYDPVESTSLLLEGPPIKPNSGELERHRISRLSPEEVYRALRGKLDIGIAKSKLAQWRRISFGLVPVGAKVHLLNTDLNEERLELLSKLLGLSDSGFTVMHASRSMLIPPAPSDYEVMHTIQLLGQERIIDGVHPELQITTQGRISPKSCAFLGAAVLLGTSRGVDYDEASFNTSHDHLVGYRLMSYDAGNTPLAFPFGSALEGRTDILARRHFGDITLAQRIKTVLNHLEEGGRFEDLGEPFKARFGDILARYGIDGVLDESWILPPDSEPCTLADRQRHFEKAVRPCTEAWFRCEEEYQHSGRRVGIVSEVDGLIDWLFSRISVTQRKMLEDPGLQKERDMLFNI